MRTIKGEEKKAIKQELRAYAENFLFIRSVSIKVKYGELITLRAKVGFRRLRVSSKNIHLLKKKLQEQYNDRCLHVVMHNSYC